MPAWYLTFAASYITMRVKARQAGNRALFRPSSSATEAVTAQHMEEWEEGMPPDATIMRQSHLPVLAAWVNT